MTEEWREVPGSAGRYRVSNLGRVIGPQGRPIGRRDRDGYITVAVRIDGRQAVYGMHAIVARAFIGDPGGREVDHINGVRDDNRPENLRYCTRAENNRFTAESGRGAKGERITRARFSEADVIAIRTRYATRTGKRGRGLRDPNGLSAIGRDYGCDKKVIHHVVTGATWKHLPLNPGAPS